MRLAAVLLALAPVLPVELPVPFRETPKLAFDARVSGTVVVEALVDSTGAVEAAGIARSIPALDDAAAARVRTLHFAPLRQVPVVFEAPPGNGPADTWAKERCEETSFAIDVDVRPDSSGRFEARWEAKGLKAQELYVIVLAPDGAVVDTAHSWMPQQLADCAAAPAWPTWHREGHGVRRGTSGTFTFTLPAQPWWNLGRIGVIAPFHDVFDNRTVVRQRAWRIDRDGMGPLLVGDPGPPSCAAGPWHGGM